MKRLTYKDGRGRWTLLLDGRERQGAAVDRLAAYEDTGLEPEDIRDVGRPMQRGQESMSDLISREAAIRVLCEACGNLACAGGRIPRCSEYEKMQAIPAADVRPVVRGEWLPTKDDNKKRCSRCDVITLIAQYPTGAANFCPNCGADMRGGDSSLRSE